MMLEALANELLLELFEFMDAVDLFRAFSDLNSRFNALLLSYNRPHHIDLYSLSKYKYKDFYQRHLPSIIDRVISLQFVDNNDSHSSRITVFFSYGLQFDQFIYLRSLTLCYINFYTKFHQLMIDCQDIPHLTHLQVFSCNEEYMSSFRFSNIIWNLPKLTHCDLEMKGHFRMPETDSLSIEYISISCASFGLIQVYGFIENFPNLQRLHIPLNSSYSFVLPSALLITILTLFDVRSSHVMMSILQAMPNLTHLKVDAYDINCDGYQWEQIIDDYLPKLKVFRLRMHIRLRGEENNEQHVDNLIDSFRTQFWLEEHHWFIHCYDQLDEPHRTILLYTLP